MTKRVFVTGGTGFIGRSLVEALVARGDEVLALSRDRSRARARLGGRVEIVEGDPNYAGEWQRAIGGTHAVANLAGESVAARRWNSHFKQILHDSRVETTRHLVDGIRALDPERRPEVLCSASGLDYYPFAEDLGAALGTLEDDEVAEDTPPGSTFLARVCRDWEREALEAETLDLRVTLMRTGVVLGPGDGGALGKMTLPFRLFVGGRIGSGRQWFSWIHIADAVRAYLHAIDETSLRGPVNLVAPNPVRAGEFAASLGRAMGRPSWMPVPALALKAAVGEFSEHLLSGRRAVPAALVQHGFEFAFSELGPALADIFGR